MQASQPANQESSQKEQETLQLRQQSQEGFLQ
jgi:hypothetical protein